MPRANTSIDLIFRETFSRSWELLMVEENNIVKLIGRHSWASSFLYSPSDIDYHFQYGNYANAWKIDVSEACAHRKCKLVEHNNKLFVEFLIEYSAQRAVYGMLSLSLVLILLFVMVIYVLRRQRALT